MVINIFEDLGLLKRFRSILSNNNMNRVQLNSKVITIRRLSKLQGFYRKLENFISLSAGFLGYNFKDEFVYVWKRVLFYYRVKEVNLYLRNILLYFVSNLKVLET